MTRVTTLFQNYHHVDCVKFTYKLTSSWKCERVKLALGVIVGIYVWKNMAYWIWFHKMLLLEIKVPNDNYIQGKEKKNYIPVAIIEKVIIWLDRGKVQTFKLKAFEQCMNGHEQEGWLWWVKTIKMSRMSCPIMYRSRQGFLTDRSARRSVEISKAVRRMVKSHPITLMRKTAVVGSKK